MKTFIYIYLLAASIGAHAAINNLETKQQATCHLVPQKGCERQLKTLKNRVSKELEILSYPSNSWLEPRYTETGEKVYDVLIIGGGQAGIAIGCALQQKLVTNFLILDENPAGKEGPWASYAMTSFLRTPKYLTGPDCDIPSLTCQSWFEAKYGRAAWKSIKKIPVLVWSNYLQWFREVLNLPVANESKVEKLFWDKQNQCFVVDIIKKGELSVVYARKIVLATGVQGAGEWISPSYLQSIPSSFYTPVYSQIDPKSIRGKRVAILGAGSSAFDAAVLAHSYGAKEIHLFSRRKELVNRHFFIWAKSMGFLDHFSDLSDAQKWRFVAKMFEMGHMPDPEVVEKVRGFQEVTFHFNAPWTDARIEKKQVIVATPAEEFAFDHLLLATGWKPDLSTRKELSCFHDQIALWSDRFTPPESQRNDYLMPMPYLGKNFEFLEKYPGRAPYLESIFCCNGGSMLSFGINLGVGLSGMRNSIDKLINGITKQLFLEDQERCYDSLANYSLFLFKATND